MASRNDSRFSPAMRRYSRSRASSRIRNQPKPPSGKAAGSTEREGAVPRGGRSSGIGRPRSRISTRTPFCDCLSDRRKTGCSVPSSACSTTLFKASAMTSSAEKASSPPTWNAVNPDRIFLSASRTPSAVPENSARTIVFWSGADVGSRGMRDTHEGALDISKDGENGVHPGKPKDFLHVRCKPRESERLFRRDLLQYRNDGPKT